MNKIKERQQDNLVYTQHLASILAGFEDLDVGDQVALFLVSAASTTFDKGQPESSGFTSPIGSFRSRSPHQQKAELQILPKNATHLSKLPKYPTSIVDPNLLPIYFTRLAYGRQELLPI